MKEWDHYCIRNLWIYINPDLCYLLIPRPFVKSFVNVPAIGDLLLYKNPRSEKNNVFVFARALSKKWFNI